MKFVLSFLRPFFLTFLLLVEMGAGSDQIRIFTLLWHPTIFVFLFYPVLFPFSTIFVFFP